MAGLVFLCLLLVVLCIVLPVLALSKASAAQAAMEELRRKLHDLDAQIRRLAGNLPSSPGTESVSGSRAQTASASVPPPTSVIAPPPLPIEYRPKKVSETAAPLPAARETETPPTPKKQLPPPLPRAAINWEQFMGAKLFAWVGGLALFLGVAFFVKYSFEHNLIPPEMRVAVGFVVGLGLIAGGLALKRKENVVTAQTLCATGILILYAVTFASKSYYHFPFFSVVRTFAIMTLITAGAFTLAVRLDALVVGILGLAGGFLTPILLSTGQDNPLGLFGYIALLDIGLLAVARRKDWSALPILGAVGTALMQLAWVNRFFEPERYFFGSKIFVALTVFLVFEALFVAAVAIARKGTTKSDNTICGAAIGVAGLALFWGFYLLGFKPVALRPQILFGYMFLAEVGVLAIAYLRPKLTWLGGTAGGGVFGFLAIWTAQFLRDQNLNVALGGYFVFALLQTGLPLLLRRNQPSGRSWWYQITPALSLLLVLMPVLSLPAVSFVVWPLVLCVDILAIVFAVAMGSLIPVILILFLTFVILGSWMFRTPLEPSGLFPSLSLLGGFSLFFVAISAWSTRRLLRRNGRGVSEGNLWGSLSDPANLSVQLPALSAVLPFLLLIMVTLRLPLMNPSAVFALAALLVVLLLAMTRLLTLEALAAVALLSVLALEHAWHGQHFTLTNARVSLSWYLGFAAVFTIFPFLFHRRFENKTTVWAVAALSAPLHFFLIHNTVGRLLPHRPLGFVPAALAIAPLLGFAFLRNRTPMSSTARQGQLALFGGATLFFLTLIFPIQFERQWITIGWALEGAALCWLFRKIPHPGLRLVGMALLLVVFARLALNPAVLSYHPRSAVPILNWYLYTYGTAIVAMGAAACFLAPPRNIVLQTNALSVLYSLATILAFFLLNIEIADYFSAPGTDVLTFQFSGNFPRDMSYSMAWAMFALILLIVGIRRDSKPVRYASLALLAVTLLKLFLHDLSQLDQLYRIAAFIVVAIIAMAASFLYQRFLGAAAKQAAGTAANP
jgi:uncharacterized membrane protein